MDRGSPVATWELEVNLARSTSLRRDDLLAYVNPSSIMGCAERLSGDNHGADLQAIEGRSAALQGAGALSLTCLSGHTALTCDL
jgi:hypothetical protein